jgi:hypothetical protein
VDGKWCEARPIQAVQRFAADCSLSEAGASAVGGVQELSLLDHWTYALCPVDDRDEGTAHLTD